VSSCIRFNSKKNGHCHRTAIQNVCTQCIPVLWTFNIATAILRNNNTGYNLSPVSATSISHARQRQVDRDAERMCGLDQLQPDWVFVSNDFKKIAVVDLCSPLNVHPGQLQAAAVCKQEQYTPLVSALCNYIDKGRPVHFVGIGPLA
jgi:hypothetical protein